MTIQERIARMRPFADAWVAQSTWDEVEQLRLQMVTHLRDAVDKGDVDSEASHYVLFEALDQARDERWPFGPDGQPHSEE